MFKKQMKHIITAIYKDDGARSEKTSTEKMYICS